MLTKEEIHLINVDYSARIPYGLKFSFKPNEKAEVAIGVLGDSIISESDKGGFAQHTLQMHKAYLRPLSSMTDREISEFCCVQGGYGVIVSRVVRSLKENCIRVILSYKNAMGHDEEFDITIDANMCLNGKMWDWLNARMFDYRGLIEKGLAYVAPKDLYKFDKTEIV